MFDLIDVERKYPPLNERDQWGGFDCIYRLLHDFFIDKAIANFHLYKCAFVYIYFYCIYTTKTCVWSASFHAGASNSTNSLRLPSSRSSAPLFPNRRWVWSVVCCPNSVKGQLQSESWETPGDGLVIVTTVVGCDVINARNPHMQSLLRVFILTIS